MAAGSSNSLQEVKIFAREDTIWGVPSSLFVGSGVLAGGLATQIPLIFAVPVGAVLFGVLFAIYNDDPRALQAWQRSMGRPVRWSVRPLRPRSVHIVPYRD